jgi:hypothetical protein
VCKPWEEKLERTFGLRQVFGQFSRLGKGKSIGRTRIEAAREEAMSDLGPPTAVKQPSSGISACVASLRDHSGLWVMTVSGALLIFCFGFGGDWNWMRVLVTRTIGVSLTPSESWELGAITWSLLFGAYYYFTFPFLPADRVNRVLLAVLSLGTVALCTAAAYSLHNHSLQHFRYVSAIGFLFCLTDFILFWWHQGDRRKMFLESLWVADAPMIAGLAILLAFQIYHRDHGPGWEMQTFLAGAISFQLIVSNVVFILCQFGVLRRIWSPAERG